MDVTLLAATEFGRFAATSPVEVQVWQSLVKLIASLLHSEDDANDCRESMHTFIHTASTGGDDVAQATALLVERFCLYGAGWPSVDELARRLIENGVGDAEKINSLQIMVYAMASITLLQDPKSQSATFDFRGKLNNVKLTQENVHEYAKMLYESLTVKKAVSAKRLLSFEDCTTATTARQKATIQSLPNVNVENFTPSGQNVFRFNASGPQSISPCSGILKSTNRPLPGSA